MQLRLANCAILAMVWHFGATLPFSSLSSLPTATLCPTPALPVVGGVPPERQLRRLQCRPRTPAQPLAASQLAPIASASWHQPAGQARAQERKRRGRGGTEL